MRAALLLAAALRPAAVGGGSYPIFEPPVRIGLGANAENVYALSHRTLLANAHEPGSVCVSRDGAASWRTEPVPASFKAPGGHGVGLYYYSSGDDQLRDFGAVTDTMGSKRNFTSFHSDYVDVLSPANSSGAAGFQAMRDASPISITGLPHPVRCAAKGPGGCPMYLDDSGHTIVPGAPPTHVQLAEVYWGGHGLSMSVVAFVSTDFSHWTFASIVANASWFLQTEEGPNENAVCLLADGKTLL